MSKKAAEIPIDKQVLLTKSEAMALSRRNTEATFDREIGKYIKRKKAGNQLLYPRVKVIQVMMSAMYDSDDRPEPLNK